jgi:hypothetical protein
VVVSALVGNQTSTVENQTSKVGNQTSAVANQTSVCQTCKIENYLVPNPKVFPTNGFKSVLVAISILR